jgi:prolipoprotein diacylglyceryltransferase
MFACLGMFAYLWSIRRRSAVAGALFGRYLMMAGVTRFFVEFVRRNPAWLIGLTTAQWMSVMALVIGWLLLRRRGAPGNEPSHNMPIQGDERAVAPS